MPSWLETYGESCRNVRLAKTPAGHSALESTITLYRPTSLVE